MAAATSKTGDIATTTTAEHADMDDISSVNNNASLAPGSPYRIKVEKSLVRKLDAKMFLLVIIYILNYIDRNNASAAR